MFIPTYDKNKHHNGKFGYKAMYKGKCLNQIYSEGGTYEIIPNTYIKDDEELEYDIKLNVIGFHYCTNIDDVAYYYDIIRDDFEVYLIEDLSEESNTKITGRKSDCDTTVATKIKIIKKYEREELGIHFNWNIKLRELAERSRIYVWDTGFIARRDHKYKIKYSVPNYLNPKTRYGINSFIKPEYKLYSRPIRIEGDLYK